MKTHCAEVVLAAFVWLAVFATRRFGLAGLGRQAGMKRRSDAVIKRIVMLPVCVEIFLCEPASSLRSCSAMHANLETWTATFVGGRRQVAK